MIDGAKAGWCLPRQPYDVPGLPLQAQQGTKIRPGSFHVLRHGCNPFAPLCISTPCIAPVSRACWLVCPGLVAPASRTPIRQRRPVTPVTQRGSHVETSWHSGPREPATLRRRLHGPPVAGPVLISHARASLINSQDIYQSDLISFPPCCAANCGARRLRQYFGAAFPHSMFYSWPFPPSAT